MKLGKYLQKRNLFKSKEPKASVHKKTSGSLRFVIQKHAARRLHYDLRLEAEGVLKSWAVPKEPSLDPKVKRLAIMVEDHPYDYQYFEGIIPEGYGKGTVEIWDAGTYHVGEMNPKDSEKALLQGLKKGEVHFTLEGERLQGEFILIHLKNSDKDNEWLLIKKKDTASAPLDPMPRKVKPMLTTLVDAPFDDPDWIFEIKWDGFRAIAEIQGSSVSLYSRNYLSFNESYPQIRKELQQLNANAVLDGEIVVLDKKGKPSFQKLQNFQNNDSLDIYYYVFDLLYLGGKDMTHLSLLERKEQLQKLLQNADLPHVRYADHIESKGKAFFKECEKQGLEGIIGKKKASTYSIGLRSKSWVKIKTHQSTEAIICGFTEPRGSRKDIGSLILGRYNQGKLECIGHVGTGFDAKTLEMLKALLLPFAQKKSPFPTNPKTNGPVTWVKPKFVCEVFFQEWTNTGSLRHPVFKGLRPDKKPKEVT